MKEMPIQKVQEKLLSFTDDFQSLIILSSDLSGNLLTTYAPFVKKDNDYYVYISDRARHFNNLLSTKKANLYFIEDESKAVNIFARSRLEYTAEAMVCDFDMKDEFEAKFGKACSFLKILNDFKLIKLSPINGVLTLGFGAAYKVSENSIEQIRL